MKIIHKREINMDGVIFGKSDYEELSKYMGWTRYPFEQIKKEVKKIKVTIEVIER